MADPIFDAQQAAYDQAQAAQAANEQAQSDPAAQAAADAAAQARSDAAVQAQTTQATPSTGFWDTVFGALTQNQTPSGSGATKEAPAAASASINNSPNPIGSIGESIQKMLGTNGGEIFANAMAKSGFSVIDFIKQRRAARAAADLEATKNQYSVQNENARNARTSAINPNASIVRPGVSGTQAVGNQRPANAGGLISAVQQRAV